MKKFLLAFLLSTAVFASFTTSGLFSNQEYNLANNEEPYPWTTKD